MTDEEIREAGLRASQMIRLDDAIQEAAISRRDLAIRLLGVDNPMPKRIESKKSQIVKWLRGDGISDLNAERLWSVFNQLRPGRYPRNYFKKDPGTPETWEQRMESATLQAFRRRYQAELRKLRKELEDLRQEQRAENEQMLAEIRRLAS